MLNPSLPINQMGPKKKHAAVKAPKRSGGSRHLARQSISGIVQLVASRIGLDRLSIPYRVDERVLGLLEGPTLEAARIVSGILHDKVSDGLRVVEVVVEPLIDIDAGQWAEVVFTVEVNLDAEEANRQWDTLLSIVAEVAARMEDREVAASLLERIGIHFRWVRSNGL